jgi:hypothetical protein
MNYCRKKNFFFKYFKMIIFNWFFVYALPPCILILGLFGNTMGTLVVAKKNMQKIGPVLIYKCLFISDTIYLSIIINISFMFILIFYIIIAILFL